MAFGILVSLFGMNHDYVCRFTNISGLSYRSLKITLIQMKADLHKSKRKEEWNKTNKWTNRNFELISCLPCTQWLITRFKYCLVFHYFFLVSSIQLQCHFILFGKKYISCPNLERFNMNNEVGDWCHRNFLITLDLLKSLHACEFNSIKRSRPLNRRSLRMWTNIGKLKHSIRLPMLFSEKFYVYSAVL